MNKFALIGRNIKNSMSKQIYEEILGESVNYTLLDFPNKESIPPLEKIMNDHPMVSITAPYKQSFNSQVVYDSEDVEILKVINCVKKDGDRLIATNTDLLAFADIISNIAFNKIYILGDGAMSKIIQFYFTKLGKTFCVYSRRNNNLPSAEMSIEAHSVVINTCLKDYDLPVLNPSNSLLWNMNYNVKYASAVTNTYLDGLSLLKKQAEYALSFWNQ